MITLRRVTAVLTAALGLAGLLAGALLLWLSGRLSASVVQQADVVLAGPRVLDLDLRVDGRVEHLQVLASGRAPGIGSQVGVQVLDQPMVLARLAGDGRWPVVGWSVVLVGVLLLVLVVAVTVRARRRRSAAIPAGVLVAALLLSGCSWAGDDVDRDAYRDARARLTDAFPAAAVENGPPAVQSAHTPVTDAEAAAVTLLQLTGMTEDPTTLAASRLLTLQLFDPALLCRPEAATAATAPDVFAPLLALMSPDVADRVLAQLHTAVPRLPWCDRAGIGGTSVQSATGAVASARMPGGQAGRTVAFTVTAGYSVVLPDGRQLPWSVTRDVTLGFTPEQPTLVADLRFGPLEQGAGIAPGVAAPGPDAVGWDRELAARPAGADPDAAAAVVLAVDDLLRAGPVALRRDRRTDLETADDALADPPAGAGEQASSAVGALDVAAGWAQLTEQGSTVTEVRVLQQHRQHLRFAEPVTADAEWQLYDTARTPGLDEGATTDNPFAVLDWLTHLSRAAPVPCPTGVTASSCQAVEVPTAAVLTPGTPGYREAAVHARRGNPTMTFVVGVDAGRLVAVRTDRLLTGPDASYRRTDTWSFGGPVDAVAPEAPTTVAGREG